MRRLSFAVAAKMRLSLSTRPFHDLLQCQHLLRMCRTSSKCACAVWCRGSRMRQFYLTPHKKNSKIVNCVPGTRATTTTLREPSWRTSLLHQTDGCAPQGKRTILAAHTTTTTHKPQTGSSYSPRESALSTLQKCQGRTAARAFRAFNKTLIIGH